MFEVVQKVREIKAEQGEDIEYIVALPRMALYMEYSTKIYEIYLKYAAPEDMHVYSIDEIFIDVTQYLNTYKSVSYTHLRYGTFAHIFEGKPESKRYEWTIAHVDVYKRQR